MQVISYPTGFTNIINFELESFLSAFLWFKL